MILQIIRAPDEILRAESREVGNPKAPQIQKLIENMRDTVRVANGIGLAAPQIGKNIRLAVVNLEHLDIPIFAIINPRITKVSKKMNSMEEGCLSIPGVFGIVERPERCEFTAIDQLGRKIKGECEGLLAKVIQHEADHLDGVLITDKIKKYTKGKSSA